MKLKPDRVPQPATGGRWVEIVAIFTIINVTSLRKKDKILIRRVAHLLAGGVRLIES